MKRHFSIVGLIVAATVLATVQSPVSASFTTVAKFQTAASATVSGGEPSPPSLNIKVPQALGGNVFFGKNLVIGVDIVSSSSQSVSVEMVYQLTGPQGQTYPLADPVPVNTQVDPSNPYHWTGSAVVPVDQLSAIQNGGSVQYFFQGRQNGTVAALFQGGLRALPANTGIASAAPNDFFTSSVVNQWPPQGQALSVGPQGGSYFVPDMFVNDGETGVSFPAGAVSAPTSIVIQQDDINNLPPGPSGLKPVVAYTFTLGDGVEPQRPVQIVLSYPANVNGSVIGTNASPSSLASYYLDANQWQLLGQPQTDTTLHTVTGMSTHLSTFALFPVGSIGAAQSAPAQRIITPNGDGKNDYADFGNAQSDITIFDVRGRRVRTISANASSKLWYAIDDNGAVVESGVYIYQYTANGQRVSGVILVAK